MTEKIYEKTNIVKTYIAEDGTEFDNEDNCIDYENELFFNHYANKYNIKHISIPTFICNDNSCHGISFYFPQDGNEDELKKLLTIYQNYAMDKENDKWEIVCTRDLRNVCSSNLEIKIPSLTKGDNYIFYYCWREYYNNNYDYFYNKIISSEIAIAKLKNEIDNFETIFGTKFVYEKK